MATSPDGTSLDVAEFVNHGSWQHAGKPDPNCSACKAGLGFAGRYLKPMRRFDDAPEQTAVAVKAGLGNLYGFSVCEWDSF